MDSGARNFDKTFEYDATSNRTLEDDGVSGESTYYTYNAANLLASTSQLPTANPVVFEYDDAQRMTAEKDAGDQSTYFTYDQRDQPIQLDFKGGGDLTRDFTFTGTGERAIVETGGTPSYWSFDGSKLLEQRDNTGASTTTFRHNESFLDQMGSILEIEDSLGLLFPAFDQLGSTVDVVKDSDGSRAAQYSYDAMLEVILDLAETAQQAMAWTPSLIGLDVSGNEISASVIGSPLLLAPLAIMLRDEGRSRSPKPTDWDLGAPEDLVFNAQQARGSCVPERIAVISSSTTWKKSLPGYRYEHFVWDGGDRQVKKWVQLPLGPFNSGSMPISGLPTIGFGFDAKVDFHPSTTNIKLCEVKQFLRGRVTGKGVDAPFSSGTWKPDPFFGNDGSVWDYRGPKSENYQDPKYVKWYDAPGFVPSKGNQLNPLANGVPETLLSKLDFMITATGTNGFSLSVVFSILARWVNGVVSVIPAPKFSGETSAVPVLKPRPPAPAPKPGPVGPPATPPPAPKPHTWDPKKPPGPKTHDVKRK